jgi:uncharacterized protein YukJ
MQIQAYLYSNIVQVQFWDPTIFSPRNRVVYSRPITIYQGIDNPLQIVIKNQDQKSVNLTGYLVQLDIQDPVNQASVSSLAITITDYAKGLGTVTVPREVVNVLDQRIYKITVKLIDDNTNRERPLYVDDNFGASLDLAVLPAWYEGVTVDQPPDEVIDGGTI